MKQFLIAVVVAFIAALVYYRGFWGDALAFFAAIYYAVRGLFAFIEYFEKVITTESK